MPGLLEGSDLRLGHMLVIEGDHIAPRRERHQVVGRLVVTQHGVSDLSGALVRGRRPRPPRGPGGALRGPLEGSVGNSSPAVAYGPGHRAGNEDLTTMPGTRR